MKMVIKCADYETKLETCGEVTMENVYNGIGIDTDQGHFGIAQRDCGIEVCLNGVLVWSSNSSHFDENLPRHPALTPTGYPPQPVSATVEPVKNPDGGPG